MADERRRFPRIAIESTNIKLATSEAGQPKVPVQRILDFSRGGLRVELATAEPPRLGALLDISLEWTGGTSRFDASVRHVEVAQPGVHTVGIEFDDPDLVEKLLGPWLRQASPQ